LAGYQTLQRGLNGDPDREQGSVGRNGSCLPGDVEPPTHNVLGGHRWNVFSGPKKNESPQGVPVNNFGEALKLRVSRLSAGGDLHNHQVIAPATDEVRPKPA
jgi:hypothetical protein